MENYLGPWQYHFISVDETGRITITRQGVFRLRAIDATGNITDATDEVDNTPLRGNISRGNLEVIRMNRQSPPSRHFRGVKVFERVIDGELRMVLVGARQRDPFPEGPGDSQGRPAVNAQDEGVWIATKP